MRQTSSEEANTYGAHTHSYLHPVLSVFSTCALPKWVAVGEEVALTPHCFMPVCLLRGRGIRSTNTELSV